MSPLSATEAEQERIIELYSHRDATLASVGRQVGFEASTIRAVLVARGVPRKRWGGSKPRAPSVDEQLHAAELYGRGWSLDAIGALLGMSRSSVKLRLRRAGVPLRTRREAGVISAETRQRRVPA
jgi:transposase-like protein